MGIGIRAWFGKKLPEEKAKQIFPILKEIATVYEGVMGMGKKISDQYSGYSSPRRAKSVLAITTDSIQHTVFDFNDINKTLLDIQKGNGIRRRTVKKLIHKIAVHCRKDPPRINAIQGRRRSLYDSSSSGLFDKSGQVKELLQYYQKWLPLLPKLKEYSEQLESILAS